jgi:RNA polymerase sigma factor (sigma-70 family)
MTGPTTDDLEREIANARPAIESALRSALRPALRSAGMDENGLDDAIQEATTHAIEKARAGKFDRSQPLLPWLITVATNRAWDWYRKEKRRKEHEIPSLDNGPNGASIPTADPRAPDPAESAEHAERDNLIRGALLQLGRNDREALYLRIYRNWPPEQIANLVGIEIPNTVEKRLSRALKRLMGRLENSGVVDGARGGFEEAAT